MSAGRFSFGRSAVKSRSKRLAGAGVLVNAEPGVVAVGGRRARWRASMSSSRANTPASTGRSTGSSPCSTGAAGRRRGLFLRASATSRINAFPRFRFLDPAAQSLRVIIIGCGRPATGVSGLIALRGVPVFGLQRGHAALAVRPDPAMHRADARAEPVWRPASARYPAPARLPFAWSPVG